MERTTKVNPANIYLEDEEKNVPGPCWELKGENGLFLLKNSGGKTSVIHMLIQKRNNAVRV